MLDTNVVIMWLSPIVCYNIHVSLNCWGNAFISCITSALSFSECCMSLLCDNFGNKFAMNE